MNSALKSPFGKPVRRPLVLDSEPPAGSISSWESQVPTSTKTLIRITYLILALFMGSFGYWAAVAPLASAVLAPGVVAAAGRNVPIQHLEGGIVAEIFISEGDRVEKGQILYRMNSVAITALRNRLAKQILDMEIRQERLKAERDGATKLVVRDQLRERAAAEGMMELPDEQIREFDTRLERYQSEMQILKQRVKIQNDAIAGLIAQKTSFKTRVELLADELDDKRSLLEQGLTNRSDVNRLAQAEAELIGQAGLVDAEITVAQTKILEAREQENFARTQRVETAIAALAELRTSLEDMREQLNSSEHTLARSLVRAPEEGVVLEARVNTPGSVVKSGDILTVILPTSKSLLIDARIPPIDIDSVFLGQVARVRFIGAGAGETPEAEARVIYISADKLTDRESLLSFYALRLAVPDALPEELQETGVLPGMPVETLIPTGERTFLQYLTKRFTDSIGRSFRQK